MAIENYKTGSNLQAGPISTRQLPIGIDTYYKGMLLEYQADGVAVKTGTGTGTVTNVIAGADVQPGVWVLTMTGALAAKLADPNGNIVAQGIALTDGGAVTVKIAGITMTITDGGTPFVATDSFAITIESAGTYVALDKGQLGAIYNGTDGRVLAAEGVDDCIVGGEIYKRGIVDASG
ncbi:MAG: hypothetical protein EOM15_16785, partial [Spirochaetia bacterium]|nr:hypothetical protein [Spirochaetia bacterium]